MSNVKEVKRRMNDLILLRDLTRAYAQISSLRMKKNRVGVLSNREFLGNIETIFQEVRRSYRAEILRLMRRNKRKNRGRVTFLAHNGKVVAVLLSSNTGLYGEVVNRTFDMFSKEVAEGKVEATVIGRLGRSLFLERFPDRGYTYFDYPDVGMNQDMLVPIVNHLVQYEAIHIYYGKFVSVVSQKPDVLSIAAETPVDSRQEEAQPASKFIFEPTLEEIMMFFESEMFNSLFVQAIHESQLAKQASRMIAMDRAYENIGAEIKKVGTQMSKVVHEEINKKQLGIMSSFKLWRRV